MKVISISVILIFVATWSKAQSDSAIIARFDKKIKQIEYENNRPYRDQLDSEDFILIADIMRMQRDIHVPEKVVVDSVISIITQPKTPYVLVDTLTTLILSQQSYYGVTQLLEQIQVPKILHDEKAFPIYDGLKEHSDIGLVYLYILFSDYLNDYNIEEWIYGDSVNLLIALFNGNIWTKDYITTALDGCKNEHKRKILNALQESLEK